jgi:serine/threonine protein kinase
MNQTPHQLARSIRAQWRDGQPPDTLAALSCHPILAQEHSALIQMAYEEFCLRRHAGETVDPEEFSGRFPACRTSLRDLLSLDGVIGAHSSMLDDPGQAQVRVPPPVIDDWPEPGDDLCGCRLVRVLGQGSFARVYLATEASTGDRPVAVKVSRMTTNEACTLGRLHHSHVVPILWASRDEQRNWNVVCMPFFGSATLMDVRDRLYLKEASLPPDRARAILDAIGQTARPGDPPPDCSLPGPDLGKLSFVEGVARLGRQLAEALAFLHEQNLYHCDLKPPNVLLTAEGRPLLLDFNLSRRGAESLGRVGGTFAYMAPEHLAAYLSCRPLSDEQASRADLFALGVMLYELLTGRPPFGLPPIVGPRDAARVMLEQQKKGFLPVRRVNPAVPRRLARQVESCLSADPAGRPASARKLAADLRPWRYPPWLVGAAAALVLLVVAGVLSGLTRPRGPRQDTTQLSQKAREQIRIGIKRHRQGQVAEADQHLHEANTLLDQAIEAHRYQHGGTYGHWEDYFRKCRVQLLMELWAQKRPGPRTFVMAQGFFLESLEARKAQGGDPSQARMSLAYGSYCFALGRRHDLAVRYGDMALDSRAPSVVLLSNIAYSAMQAKDLPKAKRYLDRALEMGPNFQAALRNRAELLFRASSLPAKQRPEWAAMVPFVLESALTDIEQAIALARKRGRPESADLNLLAARIAAQMANSSPGPSKLLCIGRSREYLERACELGASTNTLPREMSLTDALGPLSAKDLALLRKQNEVAAESTYLVDPLPDDYD